MKGDVIHVSIDDVILVFKELTGQKPVSIFDIPFFHYFKRLHKRHGLKVSCYCFYQYENFTLASCTRNYRSEFEANSDWLRFGFHGYSGAEDYETLNEMESERQYDAVMGNLSEIVGEKALDATTRIHKFKATKEFFMYMRRAKYPVQALLAADDNRLSYSLSTEENRLLQKKGIYNVDNMRFIRTSQRFDYLRPLPVFRLFTHFRGGVNISLHMNIFSFLHLQ